MKKFSLIAILLMGITSATLAQRQYIPKEQDWFFYDLTYLKYQNAPEDVNMKGWPNGHSLSFMRDQLFGSSNFSLGYGLAYTSNNYQSNLRIEIDEATGHSRFTAIDESIDYEENKLTIQYFEIPVELRFRSRPNEEGNFFRWYVGARGGIRFNAYHKLENDNITRRHYHPDELNRWRAGVYTRIGYGLVSLYGYYGLLDIFDYDHDDAVNGLDVNGINSLAVGLSLGF